MRGRSIDDLAVGDAAEISRVVTGSDIAQFVQAVGDLNPIHSDPAYAAATSFGEPIAPGVWTAGLVSAAIGTRLPGPGSIYSRRPCASSSPSGWGIASPRASRSSR